MPSQADRAHWLPKVLRANGGSGQHRLHQLLRIMPNQGEVVWRVWRLLRGWIQSDRSVLQSLFNKTWRVLARRDGFSPIFCPSTDIGTIALREQCARRAQFAVAQTPVLSYDGVISSSP